MTVHASPHYWMGHLSAMVGEALRAGSPIEKPLRATLAEFVASPVPSEELRERLRPYLNERRTKR